MVKMSADEKRWQIEADARTLIEAENIKSEKSRLNAALKEVKKVATEAEKTVKRAKKVAGSSKSRPKRKTTTRTKRKK